MFNSKEESQDNTQQRASSGKSPAETQAAGPASQNKRADNNSGASAKDNESNRGNGGGRSGRQRRTKNTKKNGTAMDQHANWSLDQFQVPEEAGKTRFHDLGLDERLMHGIADAGFQYCSPIQAASLPHTLRGNDVIGKAQTGTGKTAAFLVTIFNDLLSNPVEEERFAGEPRALVIAPTRELVVQIGDDAKQLGKYCGLNVSTLIGGMDYQKQLERLNSGLVDIVVATPGRLLDFTGRRDLYLDQVEVLVIDEADRMLDMGFIPQVKRIVRQTPRKTHRQTLLFSATFTEDIIRLTDQWTYEPVRIEIEPEHVATDSVDQKVYLIESQDKFRCLLNIVRQPDAQSVIIFANRRDEVRRLHERLRKAGVSCGILSGEIPQNKRSRTLQDFKDSRIQCLVATDVAGRGIHVDGISHVVNYTLPEDPDDYVHRIGRTGRAGATGTSISFACEDDAFLLPAIETELGMKLPCEQPPADLLS
ncbi:ATP-dependent RNA helicase RhlB [Spongiibacter nanhainus]|uniref:ATP-dependent RNA helicase RhlB n=2 Tax=Spongiibacter nanhainus TaxID=2794344 RepID=A0A7T4R4C5_9GAMM|nr:ATP-dependent RNA helicase RhlB [Spongiibacter nanhainus]